MKGTAFQEEGPASAKQVPEGSVRDERSEWLEPLTEVGDGDKLEKGQRWVFILKELGMFEREKMGFKIQFQVMLP